MVQQFPQDYVALPNLQKVWRDVFSKAPQQYSLAAQTPVPDEPSARVGIQRMLIGMYYWRLRFFDTFYKAQQKSDPGYRGNYSDILPSELPLVRKAAYELLQDVGPGGLSIDVDKMAQGKGGSKGYYMQPWEEDCFACEEAVKRFWQHGAGAVLPESGFCTRRLEAIVRFPEQGTASAD